MKNLLVIRLSAMGDVALAVPVLQAVCTQNEGIHCTVVTRPFFKDLFVGIPNLSVFTPDLKQRHKGFLGLIRLFFDIQKARKIDTVIDLHDVLRSTILRNLFGWSGQSIFKIDKGRAEKKAATAKNRPSIVSLTHTTERYAEVFRQAGWSVDMSQFQPLKLKQTEKTTSFLSVLKGDLVGIAPFAQHAQKRLPIEKIEATIEILTQNGMQILLFGGGASEQKEAESIAKKFPKQVFSIIGKFNLLEEMTLMQEVKIMLTMDSSNMHLARLVGTKVVSIWGATHPKLGFSPFQQDDNHLYIQIPVEELPCRPCSVYGNKVCHRGDWACLNRIEVENIVSKI